MSVNKNRYSASNLKHAEPVVSASSMVSEDKPKVEVNTAADTVPPAPDIPSASACVSSETTNDIAEEKPVKAKGRGRKPAPNVFIEMGGKSIELKEIEKIIRTHKNAKNVYINTQEARAYFVDEHNNTTSCDLF